MTDKTLLRPGDPFPGLIVNLPGGRTVHLPGDLAGRFGVVLIYRGAWCPSCNAQLSAFQRALDGLAQADAWVVALSVDEEATTRDLIARHDLRFPVGHSADAAAVTDATGAFVNPDPPFLQSTGLVLDPGGRVIVGVYSSGAIGRLVPQDVIGLIGYPREHAPADHPPAPLAHWPAPPTWSCRCRQVRPRCRAGRQYTVSDHRGGIVPSPGSGFAGGRASR